MQREWDHLIFSLVVRLMEEDLIRDRLINLYVYWEDWEDFGYG